MQSERRSTDDRRPPLIPAGAAHSTCNVSKVQKPEDSRPSEATTTTPELSRQLFYAEVVVVVSGRDTHREEEIPLSGHRHYDNEGRRCRPLE